MKPALSLCSLALNPAAPSPTASMVKLENGHMTAFGGLFCVSVPQPVEVGCCFNPSLAATFFRKERKAVAYTIDKGKLTMREGKEKLVIPCLPPEEMVTLDVLSTPAPCTLDLTHFRSLVDVINPANSRVWAQGISFRYGMMEATNDSVIISAISGLPDAVEFNLPVDSAKALMKFKTAPVSIATDSRAVKFYFADGSSLTSLVLTEQMIETARFFEGEWIPLSLKDTEDLLKLECDAVTLKGGNLIYAQEKSKGIIEGACATGIDVTVGKVALDRLLRISSDILVSDDGHRLMAVADLCRGICSTRR